MAALSRLFDWSGSLVIVKPDTLVRWRRKGFRLFWRWKSKPTGRPRLPAELRDLIREMAAENPTWGEERISNELSLKLGIRVSPRTVAKYRRPAPLRQPDPRQRCLTFVRNHAKAIVACGFFVVVTASFRLLYVSSFSNRAREGSFLTTSLTTRRRTADWTLQQFRKTLSGDHSYRFVIHGRDNIFSMELDESVTAMGVRVIRTPRTGAKGELSMRAFRRDFAPGVSGLPHPDS